jgi:hypothetical protein
MMDERMPACWPDHAGRIKAVPALITWPRKTR